MRFAQRLVLIITFAAILVMAVFPPWTYTYTPPSRYYAAVRAERPAGYHFITRGAPINDQAALIQLFSLIVGPDPRFPERDNTWTAGLQFFSSRIDGPRLTIQIVVTLLLGALLYFILRGRSPVA